MSAVNISAENIIQIEGETVEKVEIENGTVTLKCKSGREFFLFSSNNGVMSIITVSTS
jgi:hypothetical protein